MKRRLLKQWRKLVWYYGDTEMRDLPRWAQKLVMRMQDRYGV